ncbi:hypothetical protein A5882_003681 [Enterococcus sp. 4E1_DIV0656]|uniref:DUF916 and DUF3324 domain-containing protein n=1 Tax=Enterococcus sp. 4E1_DIV0656 TaxID=1834180 RepID=UPI000A3B6890|nr:DUF916 and DUF3324 domain-containing protein [Enterococcus sp. 4E1_DIV0656]OTO09002.1 hypothetical protein A5882_003681 [Enterococcus sp. 4E1_DIV0656]
MRRFFMSSMFFIVIFAFWVIGVDFAEASAPNFNVQAVLPSSQTNPKVSYFDVTLKPEQEENLGVIITNNTQEEMTLDININTATTNSNGVINYGFSEETPDNTLPIDFSEIATVESPTVTLAAEESRLVEVQVVMPSQSFDGVLLGGITISEQTEQGSTQITNRFSYALAVVIHQTDQEVLPKVDLTQVQAEQRNRRNFVVASVQNQTAMILGDVSIEAEVFKQGEDTALFTAVRSDMRMAPSSTLPFGVSTGTKPLEAGIYRMELVMTSGEDKWQFEKEFEITAKEARQLNEQAVNLETDNTRLYLIITGAVVAILVGIIGWLIYTRRKK